MYHCSGGICRSTKSFFNPRLSLENGTKKDSCGSFIGRKISLDKAEMTTIASTQIFSGTRRAFLSVRMKTVWGEG